VLMRGFSVCLDCLEVLKVSGVGCLEGWVVFCVVWFLGLKRRVCRFCIGLLKLLLSGSSGFDV